jgi:hypothetical protein
VTAADQRILRSRRSRPVPLARDRSAKRLWINLFRVHERAGELLFRVLANRSAAGSLPSRRQSFHPEGSKECKGTKGMSQ